MTISPFAVHWAFHSRRNRKTRLVLVKIATAPSHNTPLWWHQLPLQVRWWVKMHSCVSEQLPLQTMTPLQSSSIVNVTDTYWSQMIGIPVWQSLDHFKHQTMQKLILSRTRTATRKTWFSILKQQATCSVLIGPFGRVFGFAWELFSSLFIYF